MSIVGEPLRRIVLVDGAMVPTDYCGPLYKCLGFAYDSEILIFLPLHKNKSLTMNCPPAL